MIKILFCILYIVVVNPSWGYTITEQQVKECNVVFSHSQSEVLRYAYLLGLDRNLQHTLQAIVIQESFIGSGIHRTRSGSGSDKSYGVTHFKPESAKWVMSKRNLYNINLKSVKPFLSVRSGDILSLNLTLHYLLLKQEQGKGWQQMVGEYNAGRYWNQSAGKLYIDKIINNVKYVKKCIKY